MQKVQFLPSWRWFGPTDPVSLDLVTQTKAQSVVTALHHLPNGSVWPEEEIIKRKNEIIHRRLSWDVVESLPVHEEIKYAGKNRKLAIDNYKQSLVHLGRQGITTVCYNFMPVIDWVRTDLAYPWKNGSFSMLFDYATLAAFDCYILRRPDAAQSYTDDMLTAAKIKYNQMSKDEHAKLAHNIIVETQGFIDGGVGSSNRYKQAFLEKMQPYAGMNNADLLHNLLEFLNEVVPVAEAHNIRLAIHPDDPPFPVLGLPRIAGTAMQFQQIMDGCPSEANGITFCAGSLSASKDNDVANFIRQLAHHIQFVHLRNTTLLGNDGSFCESGHLEGNVDMKEVISLLHGEMQRRFENSQKNYQIPMRPDHGLLWPADADILANPGYPYHGRKKGLDSLLQLEKQVIAQE